jgi:hypothetical protein
MKIDHAPGAIGWHHKAFSVAGEMPKEGMGAFAALRPSPGEQKNNAQSRHCERQRSNPGREKCWIASGLCQTATADRSSQALLAMTTMTMLPPPPSCPRRRADGVTFEVQRLI